MLNFDLHRVFQSSTASVQNGSEIGAEGQALVQGTFEDGRETVRPSAGTSGEIYVGMAITATTNQTTAARIDEVAANATVNRVIQRVPNTGTVSAFVTNTDGSTTELSIVTTGTPTSTQLLISATSTAVATHADQQAKPLTVQYRYDITVAQLRTIQGDEEPGRPAVFTYNEVGVLELGDFYTDQFDTSVAFSATTAVTLGANGRYTQGGSGATLGGARIIQLPTAANSFLGLKFSGVR